jgi:hypothetical protein
MTTSPLSFSFNKLLIDSSSSRKSPLDDFGEKGSLSLLIEGDSLEGILFE